MDSVISSVSQSNLGNVVTDKTISGTLENPPVQIKEIRPADNMLLKFLVSEDSSLSGKLEMSVNGETIDVPIRIVIDGCLELPEQNSNQAVVRFSGIDNTNVRIVSINGENPENFVTKENQSTAEMTAPLIVETGNAVKNIRLSPLDIGTMIEKTAQNINISEEIIADLKSELSGNSLKFSVLEVTNGVIFGEELKNINTPLDNAMERIRLILQNLSEEGVDTKEALSQIKAEFAPLKNISLLGVVLTGDDGKLLAVKTPLGNVLTDISAERVKINADAGLLLEIIDVAQDGEDVSDTIVQALHPSEGTAIKHPANKDPLLRLLSYLNSTDLKELGEDLREKIPSANEKMLSNMVNFMKGALNKNLQLWLGKDLLHKLDSAGINGVETTAKLSDFMQLSVREVGGWRQIEIPFLNGEELSKIRVAVRKTDEDAEGQNASVKKPAGTRFVVDTNFSRLGSFQFDGFAVAKEKRFDLVLRTGGEIEDDLFSGIYRLFKNTLYEFDYYGSIKLHVKEKFIKVCEDTPMDRTIKTGVYI